MSRSSLALLLLLAGCGTEGSSDAEAAPPAAWRLADSADFLNPGGVFEGDSVFYFGVSDGELLASGGVVVTLGRNQNTVVYLEGVERGKRATDFELDNSKCLFVPRVSAVMAGGKVRIKNADPVLHNTHGFLDRLTVFNVALPNKDQTVDITGRIRKPGVIDVQCDAHTHMRGWIVIRDNPYFAVTDDEGRFRIADIPPGKYKVAAWHEGWVATGQDKDGRPVYDAPRVLAQEITIPPKGEATVEFELK